MRAYTILFLFIKWFLPPQKMCFGSVLSVLLDSVAEPEPEPPGAATFRVEPEPEPIFIWPEPPFLRRLLLHLFGKQKRKALYYKT